MHRYAHLHSIHQCRWQMLSCVVQDKQRGQTVKDERRRNIDANVRDGDRIMKTAWEYMASAVVGKNFEAWDKQVQANILGLFEL